MAQPFGNRALALGGGGFTGYLFEIGALTALDDLFEDGVTMTDFDLYVGVRAGAASVSAPRTHQPMVEPARVGGVGAVWRKAK